MPANRELDELRKVNSWNVNRKMLEVAQKIRHALAELGCEDEPKGRFFSEEQKQILGLMLSEEATEVPYWLWDRALLRIVKRAIAGYEDDIPRLTRVVPPHYNVVNIKLDWIEATGCIDQGLSHALLLSFTPSLAEFEWTRERWRAVEEAMLRQGRP